MTTATFGEPATSRSLKSRPRTSGMPIASKKPGDTISMRDDGRSCMRGGSGTPRTNTAPNRVVGLKKLSLAASSRFSTSGVRSRRQEASSFI